MNDDMFNELLASVEEMDTIKKGHTEPGRQFKFNEPEVRAIRMKIGMTQNKFAALIGVSRRTLENWEQGRRYPTGPARALLKIVAADPESAIRTLHS
ncbi:MAG TPA: helix-turn-helix domain-containing protein [Aeromonadales bacterium]|nr:helix-turn-helix domain-containing protein [Aeromonadales bacterium]